MDYARREYKTTARLFRDSDQEVEIQWYRVPEDAPPLPFPSLLMSDEWTHNGYDESWRRELGEVWDAPTPYSFHGELIAPTYDHVCGTADEFLNGVEFDPTREVLYDEQGVPLCCGLAAVPFFGVEVGFDALVVETPGDTCETAAPLVSGVESAGVVSDVSEQWWRWPYSGGDFDLTLAPPVGPAFTDLTLYDGDDCAGKVQRVAPFGYPPLGSTVHFSGSDFNPAAAFIWIRVTNTFGTTSYALRVDPA